MSPPHHHSANIFALALAVLLLPAPTHAGDGDTALLEFHLTPRADLQLAIWLETPDGQFVADIFVTQSTAKLGIGNRPGQPLFLSSWRAPYGPRPGVLPVWAHRRGHSYPKIVFSDPSPADQWSQGYHETNSSPETYFCRPLTPDEDAQIIDVMTCPSPATFNTDKGRIEAGAWSVYPPRNDLMSVHSRDSPDVGQFAELNDLDAVSGATPPAGPELIAFLLERDAVPDGPLVAWVEVSRERDENADWSFERDNDHLLDAAVALQHYGREFLGQPSIVYRVEFDPAQLGYVATTDYAGYGDLYGESGTLYPPDETISTSDGSGADRLALHDSFGVMGRVGVFSHGWGSGAGACPQYTPPPVEQLELEALDFNRVLARFRVPELALGAEATRLLAYWVTPATDAFDVELAKAVTSVPRVCRSADESDCVDAGGGQMVEFEIDALFGNYEYTIAVGYEDRCTNRSELALADITTPVQRFTTIDGACFVATAAYGAPWTEQLRTLRWLRDAWLIDAPIGAALVRAYGAYGPVLADRIRDVPPLRATARLLLRPIIAVARLLEAVDTSTQP